MSKNDLMCEILTDSEHIFNDYLYYYFRHYKKNLISKFLIKIFDLILIKGQKTLSIADIGSGIGFDSLIIIKLIKENPKFSNLNIKLTLVEGRLDYLEASKELLKGFNIEKYFIQMDFNKCLNIKSESFDIILCSEVVEHISEIKQFLLELHRILKKDSYFILTTDNSPNLLQYVKRFPSYITGNYSTKYRKISPENDSDTILSSIEDKKFPIYGHINLKTSSKWEFLLKRCGFRIFNYGTYESVRRGGGKQSPPFLLFYFFWSAVSYILPPCIAKYIGDTTAMILHKN